MARARTPIELPAAPAEAYLAWVAFVVSSEEAVREDPVLRTRARRLGLLDQRAASAAHSALLSPIAHQAEEGLRAGDAVVAPELSGDAVELARGAEHIDRWEGWLILEDVPSRVDVPLPSPAVAALRTAVLRRIRRHLAASPRGRRGDGGAASRDPRPSA